MADLMYVRLQHVRDTTGRAIAACLRKSSSGDKTKYVVAFGEGGRDEFYLHTVVRAALCDEGDFIVPDLGDGRRDYTIPRGEIRALVSQVMGAQFSDGGAFELDVKFVPHDPNCPF